MTEKQGNQSFACLSQIIRPTAQMGAISIRQLWFGNRTPATNFISFRYKLDTYCRGYKSGAAGAADHFLVSHRRWSVDANILAAQLRYGIESSELLAMTEELDVLKIISERLGAANVPFMLTGSFALGYYGKPRMTRDLDFVVALMERHVDMLVRAFSSDFYIDEDAARSAIKSQRMFNLMHLDSAIKVDLIVLKNSDYRHAEFERRKSVEFAGISTWITSREDLILSKLVWARDTDSEMQLRDVRTLIDESVDWPYLKDWAAKLGVAAKLDEVSK